MKKFTPILLAILLLFGLLGTANATTFFWDDVLDGGSYTFANDTRIMVIDVQTIYTPYDSGDGIWSSGGTGTVIDWKFTATLGPNVDDILNVTDGGWEESWGTTAFRIGLFDDGTATYTKTGTNESGQNTGTFTAEWSTVSDTNVGPLNPPAPWYAILDITRVTYGGSPYTSSGTVTGAIGNDPTAPVPEPATLLLLGSGLAGLAFYRRKRK